MLARQCFGPATLAHFNGIDDGAVLRLPDHQRLPKGGYIGLLIQKGAR